MFLFWYNYFPYRVFHIKKGHVTRLFRDPYPAFRAKWVLYNTMLKYRLSIYQITWHICTSFTRCLRKSMLLPRVFKWAFILVRRLKTALYIPCIAKPVYSPCVYNNFHLIVLILVRIESWIQVEGCVKLCSMVWYDTVRNIDWVQSTSITSITPRSRAGCRLISANKEFQFRRVNQNLIIPNSL